MDELGKAILKLDRRIRDVEKLHRAVELYLRMDPYRLLYEALNLDKLPPEERRRLLIEARTLLKYIDSEPGIRINLGLEDNLLLLAWLLILFPEPFLSDTVGLGVMGVWALIKKAKGEQIDLSTIRYSLKRGMEILKKY
ncbi:MAG: hypothetical protein QXQ29_00670 [Candidatus Bathyarchaeia archaeon]